MAQVIEMSPAAVVAIEDQQCMRLPAAAPPRALTLYAIEEHLAALVDTAEMVEEEQEKEFIAVLHQALSTAQDKRDAVAQFRAHGKNQIAFSKEERKRLDAREAAWENALERLDTYIVWCIRAMGEDERGKYRKLEGHTSTIRIQRSPVSVNVLDAAALPQEYFRVKVIEEPDLTAIREALEAGIEVPGAELLTDKYHVRVQ